MDIANLLAELELTPDNSVVIGSGILNALGLRASNDVDVVVTIGALERPNSDKRFAVKSSLDRTILVDGFFEIGTSWGVLQEPES